MLANNFGYMRDIFYLSAIFLGLGLGLFARCKIKTVPASAKNTLTTVAICLGTVFAALLCPVIILSKGYFIFDISLLIVFFVICILFAVAAFFPIPFGFPLIIVLGFAILSSVYYFFRYPSFDSITEDGKYVSILKLQFGDAAKVEFADNIFSIGILPLNVDGSKKNIQTYNINTLTVAVDYKINTIRVNRLFPLIGNKIFIVPLLVNLIDNDGFKMRILPENKAQKSLFNNLIYFQGKPLYIKNYSDEIIFENISAPGETFYELFFTDDLGLVYN